MECEVCGNDYRDGFTVTLRNDTYAFDCFECAIHDLAPTCAHCGCRVIGHGLSEEGEIFCCEHCVRMTVSARDAADEDDADDDEADTDDDDEDDEDEDDDDDEEEEVDFEVDDDLEDDEDEGDEEDETEEAIPAPRRR